MVAGDLIQGRAALIVIDIQAGTFDNDSTDRAIPTMPGYRGRMAPACRAIDTAGMAAIPAVFAQEIHRAAGIDFGRGLDRVETVHCLDTAPGTPLGVEQRGIRDHLVPKRQFSATFGSDLETDDCVHGTCVDAHQSDDFVRVIEKRDAGTSRNAHAEALPAIEDLQTGARRSLDETCAAMIEKAL